MLSLMLFVSKFEPCVCTLGADHAISFIIDKMRHCAVHGVPNHVLNKGPYAQKSYTKSKVRPGLGGVLFHQ